MFVILLFMLVVLGCQILGSGIFLGLQYEAPSEPPPLHPPPMPPRSCILRVHPPVKDGTGCVRAYIRNSSIDPA